MNRSHSRPSYRDPQGDPIRWLLAAVMALDSAASLLPRAEMEGEMGDHYPGLQSRLMSQALRKLAGPVRSSGTVLIFTNQVRVILEAVG
jgi:recombination protein RecA